MSRSNWHKPSYLRDAKSGSVAIQYGIMFLAIMVLAGAAIDFGRQETAERELTAAADAAAIAGAKMAMTSDKTDEIKAHALTFLKDNFKTGALTSYTIDVIDNQVSISARADVKTTLLALGGVPKFEIHSDATAQYGRAGTLEIALVLDTSTSMNGAPLDALKIASTDLANSIVQDGDDASRISIIPFGNYVNIGTQHRGASWLDLSAEYSETVPVCAASWTDHVNAGCLQTTAPCVRDGLDTTCFAWDCSSVTPPTPTCAPETRDYKWWGCVNSRDEPRNIQDTGYVSYKVEGDVGLSSWACGAPVLPLSSDLSDIEDAIDDLFTSGDTYMATGLSWGYRALTPNRPFDEGEPFTSGQNAKVLILMSDGSNTKSLEPDGQHWGGDVDAANTTTLDTCTEIKGADIEIYTVAFNLPSTATRALLKECASEDKNFLIADGAVELAESFQKIGVDLLDIALVN